MTEQLWLERCGFKAARRKWAEDLGKAGIALMIAQKVHLRLTVSAKTCSAAAGLICRSAQRKAESS